MSVASKSNREPASSSTPLGGARKVDPRAGVELDHARRAADAQALLAQVAAHNAHRAGRAIVVVEARVVSLAPADQPDRQVLVGEQLLVDPLERVVAHELLPERRAPG